MNKSVWSKIKVRYKEIITTTLLVSAISIVALHQYEITNRGLNVVYGEKNIGVVRDREKVMEVVTDIEQKLSDDLKRDIEIDNKILFVETSIKEEPLTEIEEIEKAITQEISYSAIGYAIEIDGEEIACLKSEQEAEQAIEQYKEEVVESIEKEVEFISQEIIEEYKLVKTKASQEEMDNIDTVESAITKIKTGGIQEIKHIIEDQENFWTLSEKYNITMEKIQQANPDKDTKKLKAGDQVVIPLTKPLLTVVTYEENDIKEEIDFPVDYEIDDDLYVDKEEIKIAGEKGNVERRVKVKRENGIEVEQVILYENLIKEPVTQIVAKGTKPIPLGTATGSFITPSRGRISSPFGPRWGSFHGGIDIAARIGEPIKASDGGIVIHSSYNNGGYGYMVDIDHGNGYVTRYAHCSKIYVENGEKVNKGDVVAAVGNTGRSTGPHLHFEVRKNGKPQNPQDYLN